MLQRKPLGLLLDAWGKSLTWGGAFRILVRRMKIDVCERWSPKI
jgi:hypothetical protein